jgi:predicted phage terminase large subunit-like protein
MTVAYTRDGLRRESRPALSVRDSRPVTVFRPQAGPQEAFLASPADIVIYGGSAGAGKTFGLLLDPVRHHNVPNFNFVCFRRNATQVTNEGGLWDTSYRLYPHLGARPRMNSMEWVWDDFDSSVRFAHLEHEKTVLDWQGAQIQGLAFDELTHFTAHQFWYMISRMRNGSGNGIRPYLRATTNPDPDSFVAALIAWWINQETGYPIPERSGVIRWFVRINDELHWANTAEELRERFHRSRPKSLTFIAAKLSDNKILEEEDPEYRANLEAQTLIERERLLEGNWKIRPEAGLVFNREWFRIDEYLPPAGDIQQVARVRYWDKAATMGAGDYTVGLLLTRVLLRTSPMPIYYVENVVREQLPTGEREKLIRRTAEADGRKVVIGLEQEPGSGGVDSVRMTVANLAGFAVVVDKPTGAKEERAQPVAAQANHGHVRLIRGHWNEGFRQRLHAFPTKGVPDDEVDALSGAFNALTNRGAWAATRFPV